MSCCHTLSSSMLAVAGLGVASTPCMLGSISPPPPPLGCGFLRLLLSGRVAVCSGWVGGARGSVRNEEATSRGWVSSRT